MEIVRFAQLLVDIEKRKNTNFSGLGLIVYNNIDSLPVSSMIMNTDLIQLPIINYDEVIKTLLTISTEKHPYHDGFHLLSKKFALTHICEYFSTPIIRAAAITSNKGSRYRTALYGSYLPSVYASGVVSKHYGLELFKEGIAFNPYDLIKVND